jgi:hypothetical protein
LTKCLDDDVEKFRVGEHKAGGMLLVEPPELVVLLRCTVLGISRPAGDGEDPGVIVSPGQPSDKTNVVRHDDHPKFLAHLACEGIEIRLALLDVPSGGIPAARGPYTRGISMDQQDPPRSHEQATNDVVEPRGLGHLSILDGDDRRRAAA